MDKNDKVIDGLMNEVEAQRKALGSRPRHVLCTNGVFRFSESNFFNINAVQDIDVLVGALANVVGQMFFVEKAMELLGIVPDKTSKNNLYWGYSLEDWVSDLKNRVEVLQWDIKKKKLDSTVARLDKLVSEEARKEKEIDQIRKEMGV